MGLERCIEKEEFDESSLLRETQHHLASCFHTDDEKELRQ